MRLGKPSRLRRPFISLRFKVYANKWLRASSRFHSDQFYIGECFALIVSARVDGFRKGCEAKCGIIANDNFVWCAQGADGTATVSSRICRRWRSSGCILRALHIYYSNRIAYSCRAFPISIALVFHVARLRKYKLWIDAANLLVPRSPRVCLARTNNERAGKCAYVSVWVWVREPKRGNKNYSRTQAH